MVLQFDPPSFCSTFCHFALDLESSNCAFALCLKLTGYMR